MAKQTKAERVAEQLAARQAQDALRTMQRVADEKAKRVYSDEVAWKTENDKGAQALFAMVREYNAASEDLAKRLRRMQDEVAESLVRLGRNELDALRYSNPMTKPGSDIENVATKRRVLADSIAHLCYATGWYVPDIHDERSKARRAKLLSIDVVRMDVAMHYVTLDGVPVTTKDFDGAGDGSLPPLVYGTTTAAWLAVRELLGDYY